MEQYIKKSDLVAEIERLNQKAIELYGYSQFNTAYNNVLKSINNLEVKEVDLKKEYEKYYEQERYIQTFKLAKYFFELGLKAQKGE